MDDLTAERYAPVKRARRKPPTEPDEVHLERQRLAADALRGAGRPRKPGYPQPVDGSDAVRAQPLDNLSTEDRASSEAAA